MRLAVTIATHNRLSELQRTCAALRRLQPPPDELWICADGCTDGTAAWVRTAMPEARLIEHPRSLHSIRSRDEMARATQAEIIAVLDDDSYPLTPDFVSRAKAHFAARPTCAVLSFPQQTDEFPDTLGRTAFGPSLRVGSFVNAASAIRRATYIELGGLPLEFEHMGDEPDYALRCIAAGWDVIHVTDIVVRHHWSAMMRNEIRNHHRHARNEAWSILLRCPAPWWPLLIIRRAAGQFAYALKRGPTWLAQEPRWWWGALRKVPAIWGRRAPVDWRGYRRWLQLRRMAEAISVEKHSE